MGHVNRHEALALRWAALCNDPLVRNLPGKIELNGYGVMEMSPASNRHGIAQGAIAQALGNQLPGGTVIVECAVATSDGVRVPDVAWASAVFMAEHGDTTPFTNAPDLCIEVRSPSNTDDEMALKTRLYLEAGALEVWIVSEEGAMQVFDAHGECATSRFVVKLTLPNKAGAEP
jgi:Uma2 family endonuclease